MGIKDLCTINLESNIRIDGPEVVERFQGIGG